MNSRTLRPSMPKSVKAPMKNPFTTGVVNSAVQKRSAAMAVHPVSTSLQPPVKRPAGGLVDLAHSHEPHATGGRRPTTVHHTTATRTNPVYVNRPTPENYMSDSIRNLITQEANQAKINHEMRELAIVRREAVMGEMGGGGLIHHPGGHIHVKPKGDSKMIAIIMLMVVAVLVIVGISIAVYFVIKRRRDDN